MRSPRVAGNAGSSSRGSATRGGPASHRCPPNPPPPRTLCTQCLPGGRRGPRWGPPQPRCTTPLAPSVEGRKGRVVVVDGAGEGEGGGWVWRVGGWGQMQASESQGWAQSGGGRGQEDTSHEPAPLHPLTPTLHPPTHLVRAVDVPLVPQARQPLPHDDERDRKGGACARPEDHASQGAGVVDCEIRVDYHGHERHAECIVHHRVEPLLPHLRVFVWVGGWVG